jgi:hypothetical protein
VPLLAKGSREFSKQWPDSTAINGAGDSRLTLGRPSRFDGSLDTRAAYLLTKVKDRGGNAGSNPGQDLKSVCLPFLTHEFRNYLPSRGCSPGAAHGAGRPDRQGRRTATLGWRLPLSGRLHRIEREPWPDVALGHSRSSKALQPGAAQVAGGRSSPSARVESGYAVLTIPIAAPERRRSSKLKPPSPLRTSQIRPGWARR